MRVRKFFLLLFAIVYVIWNVFLLQRTSANNRIFGLVVAGGFLVLCILVPLLLVKVKIADSQVIVEGWRTTSVPFAQIRYSLGCYLFPWQLGLIISKALIPGFALFEDAVEGRRKSPFQRGIMAQRIYSKVTGNKAGGPD